MRGFNMNKKQLLLTLCMALVPVCLQGASKQSTDLLKVALAQRELDEQLVNTVSSLSSDDVEPVQKLIKAGANINYQDEFGSTALIHAASGGHYNVAKFLIERGANINHKDNYGQTALIRTLKPLSFHRRHIVELLIGGKDDIDINAQNEDGTTALMFAVEHDAFLPTVMLLMQKGADMALEDMEGRTALSIARSKRGKMVEYLKEYRAKQHYALRKTIFETSPLDDLSTLLVADYCVGELPKPPSASPTEKADGKEERKEPATKK
jgi:hypothetical protein